MGTETIPGMKNGIYVNNNTGIAAGTIRYIGLNSPNAASNGASSTDPSNTANNVVYLATIMPMTGAVKKLYWYLNSRLGVGINATITLMINGVASAVTVTGGAGATGTPILLSGTAFNQAITAGDIVSLKIDNSNGGSISLQSAIAIEFDPF